MDVWVEVPNFSSIEVTKEGKIRTKPYTAERTNRQGTKIVCELKSRELTPHISDNGYLRFQIQRRNIRGPLYIHRMIALAFVPGHQPGFHVNHINGVKTDNRPENLEWVPSAENVRHAWRTGLNSGGEHAGASKLKVQKVHAIRRAQDKGVNDNTIAILTGMSVNAIAKIRSGETWKSLWDENSSS